MKKIKNQDFRNSDMARVRPKRHIFHSLLYDNKPKRHRTDTGLVEDSTSGSTIVRIIGGLLLVHLIVIGGVLLRGHMVKSNSGVAVAPTITPPPAQQAPAPAEEVLPQPTAVPAATATATPAAPAANHITQAPAPQDATVTLTTPAEPVLVTPPPAPAVAAATPAAPAAPAAAPQTTTVKHYVASGDTWYSIAKQYGSTVEALQAANPKSAQKNVLFSGTYLNVPVPADSAHAQTARAENAAQEAASAAKIHVVKRGENLGIIAKRNKISLQKLMKLNNLTEKDARRIRVGQELKVSE